MLVSKKIVLLVSFFCIICFNQVSADTLEVKKLMLNFEKVLMKNPVKAIEIGKLAQKKLSADIPEQLKAMVLTRIAYAFVKSGDPKTAITYLNMALPHAKGDNLSLARVYEIFGVVYTKSGELNLVIENLLKATAYFEKSGVSDKIWSIKQNLGICYAQIGQLDKSLQYLKEVLKINEKLSKNSESNASAYLNLGVVYEMTGHLDSTLIMYSKAYAILLPKGNSTSLAMLLNNMGTVSVNLKKYADGLKYLNKGYLMMLATGDKQGAVMAMNNIADVEDGAGNLEKALRYSRRAYDLSDSLHLIKDLIFSCDRLAKTYYKLGDTKSAYLFSQKYSKLKDSVTTIDGQKQIAEMQTKYETDKKEKEIALLNKDNLLHTEQLAKEKNFRYSLIGIAAMVVIIAILLFYSLKSKQKTNKQLDIQNKKISEAFLIIEEKQKEILDSIHYAKRIQTTLITSEKYIEKALERLTKK